VFLLILNYYKLKFLNLSVCSSIFIKSFSNSPLSKSESFDVSTCSFIAYENFCFSMLYWFMYVFSKFVYNMSLHLSYEVLLLNYILLLILGVTYTSIWWFFVASNIFYIFYSEFDLKTIFLFEFFHIFNLYNELIP
jgi:hypothetical protein